MTRPIARLLLLLLATWAASCAPAHAQQQQQDQSWKAVYFYDADRSALHISHLYWPGPGCMVALGSIQENRKSRPVAIVSTDEGKTWSIAQHKRWPRSAFFLNPRLGWLVTENGIERTGDCAATGEPAGAKANDLLRVWFRDEALGWGVGLREKAVVTRDGGRHWEDIQFPRPAKGAEGAFTWVAFGNEKVGVISGWTGKQPSSAPPLRWLDPDRLDHEKAWPSTTRLLITTDGGSQWQPLDASLIGRVAQLRMANDGAAIVVVEMAQSVDWPSDVYVIDFKTNRFRRIHRDPGLFITDAALGRDRWVYLAGVDVPGSVRLPAPNKVRILRSRDARNWQPMRVDYRASAQRVTLATSPDGRLVAATDTGMILRLE